ncbi:hypothetical protein EPO17_01365 [Patescibacteria group bacterium]|nr:MAG: hypothetical protein EPO17_01365 [Patescibacteria group bacterium]
MNKLIFPIILILAAIGIFVTFTQPHYDTVRELMLRSQDYQKVFADADGLLRKRDSLTIDLNKIRPSDKARISKLIPDSIDNVRLVIDINDGITSRYGVGIKNIRFETPPEDKTTPAGQAVAATTVVSKTARKDVPTITENKDYNSVTLNFTIVAPYNTFLKILRDLESSLRIVDVTAISFRSTDASDVYQYDLGIKTHWLK